MTLADLPVGASPPTCRLVVADASLRLDDDASATLSTCTSPLERPSWASTVVLKAVLMAAAPSSVRLVTALRHGRVRDAYAGKSLCR